MKGDSKMKITTIGIDLAKNIFQIHATLTFKDDVLAADGTG